MAYIEARDYWKSQVEKLNADIMAYIEARDYWKSQSEAWECNYYARSSSMPPRPKGLLLRALARIFKKA
jgi:hypothetical protein